MSVAGGIAETKALRVLSLFAGIGGFDLGLKRTGGFVTTEVAELDPYASKVLAKRFPNATNAGDVTKATYRDADIICAGFPCQDISLAGKGAGLAGARSGLWREVVRAIRMVRPRYALLENVAALLARGLDQILGDLAEIGHDAEWHCIPASAVGAPHRRDRIWIIANPGSEQHEGGSAPLSGEIAAQLSRASADAACDRRTLSNVEYIGRGAAEANGIELRDEPANGGAPLADSASERQSGPWQSLESRHPKAGSEGQATNAVAGRLGNQWSAEPRVGRVAHGVPARVDRLRCLGNAVVPAIPELIGRAILEAERAA